MPWTTDQRHGAKTKELNNHAPHQFLGTAFNWMISSGPPTPSRRVHVLRDPGTHRGTKVCHSLTCEPGGDRKKTVSLHTRELTSKVQKNCFSFTLTSWNITSTAHHQSPWPAKLHFFIRTSPLARRSFNTFFWADRAFAFQAHPIKIISRRDFVTSKPNWFEREGLEKEVLRTPFSLFLGRIRETNSSSKRRCPIAREKRAQEGNQEALPPLGLRESFSSWRELTCKHKSDKSV